MLTKWISLQESSSLIGLDIGSNAIKFLKINSFLNPPKIENFASQELPPNTIVKGEIKDSLAAVTLLKDLIKKSGINTKGVALAVPRSSTFTKNITIDARLTDEEMESRVWIEAKHHFPELAGDIYLDFSIIGPSSQNPAQIELMLVACRKDILNPYIDLLKDAGLTAKVVDVNNFALERALSLIAKQNPTVKTMALLNLDLTLSSLIVTHENKLIYSHDETFDGVRLMKQVKEFPKNTPNYIETLKDKLSAHLRHTMHFFYSSRPNINIEKLVLSGDCSLLENLNTYIQEETGIETVIADPFVEMAFDPAINKEELTKQAPTLMLCCGLALSSVK